LEFPLEVLLLGIAAQVEEELAARRLDSLLRLRKIIHLKPEVVGADEALRVLQAGAALALVVQQREVDDAVAEVHRGSEVERLFAHALQPEHALVELRRPLQVLHHHREMPELCCHGPYLLIPICSKIAWTRACSACPNFSISSKWLTPGKHTARCRRPAFSSAAANSLDWRRNSSV